MVVFSRFAHQTAELGYCVSACYGLGPGVHSRDLQVISECGGAHIWQAVYRMQPARGKSFDMVRKFIGMIGSDQTQRRASGSLDGTGSGESRALANVSPAFEAWLQGYRRRLEEICEDKNPRASSVRSQIADGLVSRPL